MKVKWTLHREDSGEIMLTQIEERFSCTNKVTSRFASNIIEKFPFVKTNQNEKIVMVYEYETNTQYTPPAPKKLRALPKWANAKD